MARVAITQVRSLIKRPERQRRTMQALGLSKINQTVEKDLNPQIEGMITAVSHLVEVKELKK